MNALRFLYFFVAIIALSLVADEAMAQRFSQRTTTTVRTRGGGGFRRNNVVAVNVNSFGHRPVVVSSFGQPVFFQQAPVVFAPSSATFVTPSAFYGVQSFGGFGGSSFRVSSGGCW